MAQWRHRCFWSQVEGVKVKAKSAAGACRGVGRTCGCCCLDTRACQHGLGQEGGAGTCPGGQESGPSTGLILTLPVGLSKAPCGDQASRTTWRPWGGPCVGTGHVFWFELSRPELGAANSPWALGSGGRSQGQKGRKVGAGESPLCAGFNYSRTHPCEPGQLTCQHSGREQPGPGSTWPCGSRAGNRAGGAGGRVSGHRHCTPPPHWSTVAPAGPSWVGRVSAAWAAQSGKQVARGR